MLSYHYDIDKEAKGFSRSKEEAVKLLYSTYGSKSANRVLEKKIKMKLNVDVVKNQLDGTVNGIKIKLNLLLIS